MGSMFRVSEPRGCAVCALGLGVLMFLALVVVWPDPAALAASTPAAVLAACPEMDGEMPRASVALCAERGAASAMAVLATGEILVCPRVGRELAYYDRTVFEHSGAFRLPEGFEQVTALAVLDRNHPVHPRCFLVGRSGSARLYVIDSVDVRIVRTVEFAPGAFGPSPHFFSLGEDPRTGRILLAYEPVAGRGGARLCVLDRTFRPIAHVTVPLPLCAPFFAVWHTPPGSTDAGILLPFGSERHEGIAWVPYVAGESADASRVRAFRIRGCEDARLRAAACLDDTRLCVAAQDAHRAHIFDIPSDALIPNVTHPAAAVFSGVLGDQVVCWEAGCAQGIVVVSEEGRPVGRAAVQDGTRGLVLAGLLPGTELELIAGDPDSNGTSTLPAVVTLPSRAQWRWVRFDAPVGAPLSLVAGVDYVEALDAIVIADVSGAMYTLPADGIMDASPTVPLRLPVVPFPVVTALRNVSAMAVGPGGEVARFDGWSGEGELSRLGEGGGTSHPTVLAHAMASMPAERMFAWDAACGPDGHMLLADAGQGRIIPCTVEELVHCGGPTQEGHAVVWGGAPGCGPFGVAWFAGEILVLARNWCRGPVVLWSAEDLRAGPAGLRPREVVPVPRGTTLTGMAVAATRYGPCTVIAGNDASGPFLMVGALAAGRSLAMHHAQIVTAGDGAPAAGLSTGNVANASSAWCVVRLTDAGPHPVDVTLVFSAPGAPPHTQGPFPMQTGEGAARVFPHVAAGFSCDIVATDAAVFSMTVGAVGAVTPQPFMRGDVNVNGLIEIGDAVSLLCYLFRNAPLACCHDAADVDDDGMLSISDPIALLSYLFGAGQLAYPGAACGEDPTPDDLPVCDVPTYPCAR